MRTWFVYTESRISPKDVAQPHFFGFCCKAKVLSIQCMAGFGNFGPEEHWQCIDLDPFILRALGFGLV